MTTPERWARIGRLYHEPLGVAANQRGSFLADACDSQAREALSSLWQTYWYPLYAYLRRRGLDPEHARDLTQGFLTSLIERQDFEGLRQDRGRFRAFLLALPPISSAPMPQ